MTYDPKLEKDMGVIDWTQDAADIVHRIHGLNPWPGCTSAAPGGTWKLLRAEVVDMSGQPGEVLAADGKEGLIVAAGKNAVRVRQLQVPGGKPMDARDYLRGHAMAAGTMLKEDTEMSDENRQGSGNFRANNGGQKRPAGGNRMSGNRTGGKNFGGKKPFSGEKRSFGGSKPAFGGEKRSFGGDKPAYNGENAPLVEISLRTTAKSVPLVAISPPTTAKSAPSVGTSPRITAKSAPSVGTSTMMATNARQNRALVGKDARMGIKSRPSVGKQDSILPKSAPTVAAMGNAVPIRQNRLPRRWRAAMVCPRAVSRSKSSAR